MNLINDSSWIDEIDKQQGEHQPAQNEKLHIRVQQRNGRKSVTTLTGLPSKIKREKLLRDLKRELHCNGCLVNLGEGNDVVQLQGDQRMRLVEFLTTKGLAEREDIVVHGG
jgi:translation initiation factor 1